MVELEGCFEGSWKESFEGGWKGGFEGGDSSRREDLHQQGVCKSRLLDQALVTRSYC